MSNTNTVVKQTYLGNGSNKNFAIPFFFIAGEESVIKVYLINNSTQESTLLTLTADYTLDSPATTVTTVAAYSSGYSIQVKRVSPKIQESEFIQGPFPFEAVEEQFDRVINLVQEAADEQGSFLSVPVGSEGLVLPVPSADALIGWNSAGTALENKAALGIAAIQSDLDIVEGRVDALEGQMVDVNITNIGQSLRLDIIDSAQLIQDADISQLKIDTLANGAAIANVPAEILNLQAQINAIDDRGADVDALITLTANTAIRVDAEEAKSIDYAQRISVLEAASPISEFSGSQEILNNQAVPVELADLHLDGDGAQLGTITIRIRRRTDTGVNLTRVILIMLYDEESNTWFIGRESTIFFSGDDDGVTFSVATDVNKVGKISYVSTNMSGANYSGSLKFIGKEIPTGV